MQDEEARGAVSRPHSPMQSAALGAARRETYMAASVPDSAPTSMATPQESIATSPMPGAIPGMRTDAYAGLLHHVGAPHMDAYRQQDGRIFQLLETAAAELSE